MLLTLFKSNSFLPAKIKSKLFKKISRFLLTIFLIDWRLPKENLRISEKDKNNPIFAEIKDKF